MRKICIYILIENRNKIIKNMYLCIYIHIYIHTHKINKNTYKILEILEWYYLYPSLQYNINYYHRITNSSFLP